jgi:protocatechuate 3,4-dioxygenase beta subunit
MNIPRRGKANRRKALPGGMAAWGGWVRLMNRNVLVAILVFLVAYAVGLWFKFNDQQGIMTTVVKDDAGESAPGLSAPVMIAPEPDVPQKTSPLLDTIESGMQEVERPEPADLPQPVNETTSGVYEQSDEWNDMQEEVVVTEPQGDLAISGRVLNEAGSPVPGIRVIAKASYLFDRDKGKLTPVYKYQLAATSGNNGAYAFERLADGEYRISAEATEEYSRAHISVRAGVDSADLVLMGLRELSVNGFVSTAGGEPLAGVVVTPVRHGAPMVSSNKEGRYEFEMKLIGTAQSLAVRASKKGYEDREVRLDTAQPDAGDNFELNIVMELDDDSALAEVRGRVINPEGDPVAGKHIGLLSAKARQNYQVTTDADGRFVIRSVELGDDYMLSIDASDAYKDYFQKTIKVTKNGLTLNIELEALEVGTLSGQMLNVYGTPIPNFTLVLQTKETSFYNQRVLGDVAGNFKVEKAPAGELRLKTKSTPYYTIEGILLNAGAELQVPVILDWGYDEIQGRVVNDQGYPVAVTNISLTWLHEQNGIRSSSRRTTSTDEQGNFRFTQLGSGRHHLTINAAGYKPVDLDHDVALHGSELEVKIEAK